MRAGPACALLLLGVLAACSLERAAPRSAQDQPVSIAQVEKEAYGPIEEPLFTDAGECLGLDAPVALRLLGAQDGAAALVEGAPQPTCQLKNAQKQVVATVMLLDPGAALASPLLQVRGEPLAAERGAAPTGVTLHLLGWSEGQPQGEGLLAGTGALVLVRFQGVTRRQADVFLRTQGVQIVTGRAAARE